MTRKLFVVSLALLLLVLAQLALPQAQAGTCFQACLSSCVTLEDCETCLSQCPPPGSGSGGGPSCEAQCMMYSVTIEQGEACLAFCP